MTIKQVTVNVSAGLYDGGQALGKFVNVLRAQVAKGWNPGTDIPADLAAAVGMLGPVVSGIESAAGDFATNPNATAHALALGLTDAVFPAT